MSLAEYLEMEADSKFKHEYVNGEAYAMAGADPRHVAICTSLVTALGRRLADRPCQVLAQDQRVCISETGLYTYPDIIVVCGELKLDRDRPRTLLNPQIIMEVMSESTEAYDRGAKFGHYRRLPSLQEYILVSTTERSIDHFRRSGPVSRHGDWTFIPGSSLSSPFLAVEIPADEIYAKAELIPVDEA